MMEKKEALDRIRQIIQEGKELEEELIAFIKEDLKSILSEYFEKMTSSLGHFIHEVLETITGASSKEERFEAILKRSTEAIVDSVKEISDKSLEEAEKLAEELKKGAEKLAKESKDLAEMEEKAQKELKKLYDEFYEITETGKQGLKNLEEAVRKFAERHGVELSPEKAKDLEELAEKAKRYVAEFEQRAKKQLEKLLRHEDEKIRHWLNTVEEENRKGGQSHD